MKFISAKATIRDRAEHIPMLFATVREFRTVFRWSGFYRLLSSGQKTKLLQK
jgi:hypothetical protein